MATINDTTRKMITTAIKPTTDEYREGWERIFGKKNPPPGIKEITISQRRPSSIQYDNPETGWIEPD